MADGQRCPHDGGFCHHDCAELVCMRWQTGMALSSPHNGYPLPGFDEDPPADEAEAERATKLAQLAKIRGES